MIEERKNEVVVNSGLVAGMGVQAGIQFENIYHIECIRDGVKIWEEDFTNLVVNDGLNDSLDKHLKGSNYTAAWYVGLTTGSKTFAPGDTMASHAGWTEFTVYTQGTRPALTLGTVSGQSVNNSASKAVYTIDTGGGTAGGAFITNNSTKGGGTGTLYGGGAFSQDRVLLAGDTLNVTITCTAAAS